MDPASLDLAEGRPRVWAHSAERCAPWMHQNQAGFVYALSGSYYSPGPSQLIVCNRIAKGFVCLFSVLFIVFFVFWGIRYRATRGYGIQINWIGIKQGKNNICRNVVIPFQFKFLLIKNKRICLRKMNVWIKETEEIIKKTSNCAYFSDLIKS